MSNLEIAKLLRAVAAALDLSDGNNHFRIVAYQRAADAIEHASSEVKDLWDDGKLKELAGVGEGIASSLDELFKTGKVKHFDMILKDFPPAMFELMEVPGIGPKNALKFAREFGINKAQGAVGKLEKAAQKGLIAKMSGFGEDSQAKVLAGIGDFKNRSSRLLLDQATKTANEVIEWMNKCPAVKKINTLGSLRRWAATVGDVDLSVATDDPKTVIDHFVKYPRKSRLIEAGDHSASIIVPTAIEVDLMVQPMEAYGSLLQHFTGSKHHNVALREYALKKGFSLSEYGIKIDNKLKQFDNEKDFYNFLGLDYIPPELREGRGEIELARSHKLPQLVGSADIMGDLQIHSNIDIETSHDLGQSSLDDLCNVAAELNYEYIGLTEHNPAVGTHSKKQVIDLIKKKTDIIKNFTSDIHLFNGLEIDILANGQRALSDEALDLLDYACVSIHSSFDSSRAVMTERVLKAFDHPKVKFMAHPTARLINQREGIELDWDKLFAFCVEKDKWLEIDGWPNRLDLPDTEVVNAIKHGVKLVIDTDSHDAQSLNFMRFGVAVARRGGATAADIINTCNLKQIGTLLR